MKYFSRFGIVKKISANPDDYTPGDIVAWNLTGSTNHIGIVVDKKSPGGKRYMIVHNIGAGQVTEDVLFLYTIIGHYGYKK